MLSAIKNAIVDRTNRPSRRGNGGQQHDEDKEDLLDQQASADDEGCSDNTSTISYPISDLETLNVTSSKETDALSEDGQSPAGSSKRSGLDFGRRSPTPSHSWRFKQCGHFKRVTFSV